MKDLPHWKRIFTGTRGDTAFAPSVVSRDANVLPLMSQAWKILAALTFARMTMGFQFQSVPAMATPLMAQYDISFASLGALTGAYLLPGALVALAGGWMGQKLGDAKVAFLGLALMTLSGFAFWWATSFEAALILRALGGVGAVGLNVMATKMAADWFQTRDDLPTAMGVLVSSWPSGIALATLVLPALAAVQTTGSGFLLAAVLCLLGWFALMLLWREPNQPVSAKNAAAPVSLMAKEWAMVGLAGAIWGTYNVGFITSIAWTPSLLEMQGFGVIAAGATTSIIFWTAIGSVASGGWVATRFANRDLTALVSIFASALLVGAMAFIGTMAGSIWFLVLLGIALGLPAASIMTLPVVASRAEVRALAMGVYFAVYYVLMGVGPAAMGWLRDVTGQPASPHIAAAILLVFCLPAWAAFRRGTRD